MGGARVDTLERCVSGWCQDVGNVQPHSHKHTHKHTHMRMCVCVYMFVCIYVLYVQTFIFPVLLRPVRMSRSVVLPHPTQLK